MGFGGRWRGLRNRLVANPKFQSFASRSIFTRAIARRQSLDLFDLCAGFTYSQILLAVVRLKVLEHVSREPRTAAELAALTGLTEKRSELLAKAACSLGLLERDRAGGYGLAMKGAALIGNPWIAKFIEHHEHLYADLADPVAVLKGKASDGRLKAYWAYAGAPAPDAAEREQVEAYSELMGASQAAVAAEILGTCDFSPHTCLMDVGGGDGRFIAAAAEKHLTLRFIHVDLPAVSAIAEKRFAAERIAPRVVLAPLSFLAQPLPTGADVATLVRIAHDHDDGNVATLLAAIRSALPPQGCLIIAEPFAGNRATARVTDAYFAMYFTAMGQGRTRSAVELSAMARAAGFARVEERRTANPLTTGVLVAHCS